MSLSISHLQRLFQGFSKTSLLWNSTDVFGLSQFQFETEKINHLTRAIHKQLRLGQLAEQFIFNQLEQTKNCEIVVENIQIQKEKQTLGELDTLIKFNNDLIHLEIVYKFYLYDETMGNTEIERWIGPNRNDSLIEKLTKLKSKQLPLLYSVECKPVLDLLNIKTEDVVQQVLFKAQLFIPYLEPVDFKLLNKDCVCGFYINKLQLEGFKTCQFYIPPKLDWFLDVVDSVDWLNFEAFKLEADVFLKKSKSPLIWIKKPNQTLLKCFLVWW